MSSSFAVRATGLSKCYQVYERPQDRLKQMIVPRLARAVGATPPRYFREFWALQGLDLAVERGTTVGVIGRNGSGKSTLLQLIAGTLAPTNGSIEVNGRVAAILELGSGFNPEFSGRENALLGASLHGLTSSQARERLPSIRAFAEIGDFFDQPVKTYSSGMLVRLAFAVIAHVDAEILIVDEALAVGDVFFAQKCMRFFRDFRDGGGTLLFVSHDTSAVVNLCDRAVWLESGTKFDEGDPRQLCRRYLRHVYKVREGDALISAESEPASKDDSGEGTTSGMQQIGEIWAAEQRPNVIHVSKFNSASDGFGLGGAEIVDAGFFDESGEPLDIVHGGQDVCLSVFIACRRTFEFPAVGLVIKDRLGQAVFTEGTTWAYEGKYDELRFRAGEHVRVDFLFVMPVLIEGDYSIQLAVAEGFGHDHVQHHLLHDALSMKVLTSRLLHGISGLNDIRIRMRFFRPSAEEVA